MALDLDPNLMIIGRLSQTSSSPLKSHIVLFLQCGNDILHGGVYGLVKQETNWVISHNHNGLAGALRTVLIDIFLIEIPESTCLLGKY